MTTWKITLLATQWLLLSAQTIPDSQRIPSINPQPMLPMALQEQILPPKQFDRDYDGELELHHMSAQDVIRICGPAVKTPGRQAIACARAFLGVPNRCIVFIMTESELARRGWSYDIILRHELGHCHGWHHD